MKKILLSFLIITAAWSGCKKNQEEDEGPIDTEVASISKVVLSSEYSSPNQTPGAATGFTFTILVPKEGIYAKLALKRVGSTVDSIVGPLSGEYKLIDNTLEYSKRLPMQNYFVWSKDDGTIVTQQVYY